jgi:GTPase SAR1 family protein
MTSLTQLDVGQARPDKMDWGMALPGEVMCSWMGTLKCVRELDAQGKVPCSMLRLLIIGMGEAGKTCLKQALMSDTDLSPPIATDDRTIAIDMHPSWKPDGDDLDFAVWDFAGQRGYQTGHSPFLPERCLSMLVFRPDQGASAEVIFEEWVRPWLELLQAHSPGAHVLLVCTRWMSPPADEELGAYQRRIRDICEGISQRARKRVEAFNKATKDEVKRLGEKASKLEQELKRVNDEMQVPPPAHGGHGARRRDDLVQQSKDLTEELEAARNRCTKLCDKRSRKAKQTQILAANEDANASADLVHLEESVEGDGSTVKSLREAIVRTARGLPFVGENIPRGWLTFKKEIQTFHHDKSILVTRDSLMFQLRRDSPQLQTWLVGREAEDRVLEFWQLLGFMLVTPDEAYEELRRRHERLLREEKELDKDRTADARERRLHQERLEAAAKDLAEYADQSHVIVSPPKLIDLLKPLVHHQSYSELEDIGQAHTVVENFDELDFEVQGKIREMFERLEDRYILDMTLLKRLRFWAHMDDSARDQALQILCDLSLVVPHRGGARSADERRFLCVCRLHRDSHSYLKDPGPILPDIKISVKYTIFPILPLGLFPRFLATQIVARSTDRQSQPRISPTSLYMRASPLGKDQEMIIKLNPSDSIIEVQCTSIGLLRDVCLKLEQTVNDLFPGLSFHTQLRFPYGEKGMFTWDIHQHVVSHSFGTLLAQKLWNKTKMDAIKPEKVENAVENVATTAEYNVQLKNILPTLGLTASFFLSHCWKDKSKDYAKDLVSMLEDVSRDLVWYDEEQLERENHFPSKMQDGVKQAECIIIFLSRVYLSRQNCLLELQWAWEQHLLKGKSLIVLPVDEAVTVDSLREWVQLGINLHVQEPDQGGTFTIHYNTLKFVSEKLTEFKFREGWRGASATEKERWKAVQEICDYVGDARAEQKKVPKKAKLECRKADCGTWMLVDLGEEVSEIESEEKPMHDSIKKVFDKIELGSKCAKICNKLKLFTMEDLKYFEPEGLNDLPVDLLQRIEKRKLADKLATLQAEQFKIPQRPSGRASDSLRQAVKPVILGFFPKKRTDAVSVHGEAQQIYDLFSDDRSIAFTFAQNAEPTFATFTKEMHQAIRKNVRVVHLAGHGSTVDGLLWFKQQERQSSGPDYEKVPVQNFAGVFKIVSAGSEDGGTVECVVLNACETETVGKLLRHNGVPHVVCWRSQVKDETAMEFAKHFYTSLTQDSINYRLAFKMASHFVQSPHLCWLSKDGNIEADGDDADTSGHHEFLVTGVIPDDSESTRCLNNTKGELELEGLAALGFTFIYEGKNMHEGIEKHKRGLLSQKDAASYGLEFKKFNNGNPPMVLMSYDAAWEMFGVESYTSRKLWTKDGPICNKAMTVDLSKLDTAIKCLKGSRNLRGERYDPGHDYMIQNLDTCIAALEACKKTRTCKQAQAHPALARPQLPAQQQQQNGAPASYQGFDPSLSLAQALGQVLEGYSDTLATEPDIAAKMRLHPQGANWRSCLEVMVEQSVRHGALHPECPDIRKSVHCAAVRGLDGSVSQQIMVLHPAAAPFSHYCECIETMSKCLLLRVFASVSLETCRPRRDLAKTVCADMVWCSLRRHQQAGGQPAVSAGVLAADAC